MCFTVLLCCETDKFVCCVSNSGYVPYVQTPTVRKRRDGVHEIVETAENNLRNVRLQLSGISSVVKGAQINDVV